MHEETLFLLAFAILGGMPTSPVKAASKDTHKSKRH